MSISFPYAVFGVTGRTGAAAADALLRAGQPVRVVVRDAAKTNIWRERGAEVAVADLTDLASMTQALRQVRGAYLVSPPQYGRDDLFELADRIANIAARASAAAGVPRLVALSSIGADQESGTGWIRMNRMLEQHLVRSGVPSAFLRAVYFMENLEPMINQAVRTGTMPSFLGPALHAFPMVATADVGRVAAALLQDEWTGTRAVTLCGPRTYSPDDVATAVAAALGKPVAVDVLQEAAWPQALAGAGFSQAALAGFIEMTGGINRAHITPATDPEAIAQKGTTALDQVIADLVRSRAGLQAAARAE